MSRLYQAFLNEFMNTLDALNSEREICTSNDELCSCKHGCDRARCQEGTAETTALTENTNESAPKTDNDFVSFGEWLELEDRFDTTFHLPVGKEFIHLELVDNSTIRVLYDETQIKENEYGFETFAVNGSMNIPLPKNVNPNTIKASYKHNLLTISVNKKTEDTQSTTIEIE